MKTLKKFIVESSIIDVKCRSKWKKGVKEYALELLEQCESETLNSDTIEKELLNGAKDWTQYSWGASGVSFVYNWDICERLATASEQKRTHNGQLKPNKYEEWLDTQARALYQACNLIKQYI